MHYHDAIVIGAGTAGLSCLKQLKDHGVDAIAIDQKREIGKPIRSTGGIAKYFVDKLGMPTDPSVMAATISSVSLRTDVPGKEVNLRFDHPVGYVYDFTKYERYLARDLPIQLGERVLNIDKDGFIHTDQGDYMARHIIVATGPVSSLSPYKIPPDDMLVAYEETRKLPKREDIDLIIWFSKYAEFGYVWDFPSNDGRRIGLGYPRTNHTPPAHKLKFFTYAHPDVDGEVDHTIAHQIPVGPPMKNPLVKLPPAGQPRWIYYIGESAGTTFASTGGGLQGAYWSGMEAGKAVAHHRPTLYMDAWKNEIYPLLRRHYKIKRAMYRYGTTHLGDLFNTVQNFKLKSENATREIPRLIGYLLMHRPWEIPRLIGALM